MAEIKNSFLSSKMNQDLDDRLIPNGEYREALNVSIGKSENSDIGTLQNILGNEMVDPPNILTGAECIGYFMDNNNNRIFQFITTEGNIVNAPIVHRITVYDFKSNLYTILVEGAFLNFIKSSPITGINLVENLLFWTDYNNQPRKINVESALSFPADSTSPYYTREEQISVARYAPVDPISLVKVAKTKNTSAVAAQVTIPVASIAGIEIGMTLIGGGITSNDFIIVESIGSSSVVVSATVSIPINSELTFLISTMSDKADDPLWPGDPSFLKAKYVRFSYRFRYDDGEYSLMAPFTQIAYVPNQKGYFIEGNEDDAYRSTVVKWFENNINNAKLLISFPDILSNSNQSYKIQAVDILYKESDSLTIQTVETIPYSDFSNNTTDNIYIYDYQSRKPYKTLPTDQTARVYDMVPVKALAQESISNRIVYGNFLKNHTAPKSLNYQVSVTRKQDYSYNFIEYPNHTVKQNRTYQIGFVLSDKYGRQSSVILSSLDTSNTSANGIVYGGSTVYSPYYSSGDAPIVKDWFGNAISVLVNSTIYPINASPQPAIGEPGLYAQSTSITGFTLTGTTTITDTTYVFTANAGTLPNKNEFLRGQYTDYVEITNISPDPSPNPPAYGTQYTLTTSGRVNNIYLRDTGNDPNDIKYVYTLNPLGWYSYKVVVRQQEQDYYNVYLPGMLNGYPKGQTYGSEVKYTGSTATTENGINTTIFPTNEDGRVAHIVLINDNINKIPRDLVEVGPDQKLYRSSVQLFGRVENNLVSGPTIGSTNPNNQQYFPSKKADTAIAIATSTDLSFLPTTIDNPKGSAAYNFYQLETHPLVARISTTDSIGVIALENIPDPVPPDYTTDPNNMRPYLSVYETKPDYSLLDLFWETSTSGLISDLNSDVLTGFEGAVGLSEISWVGFKESANPNDSSKYISGEFYPLSLTGVPINSSGATLSVVNLNGINCDASFGLEANLVPGISPYYEYKIYITTNFVFLNDTNATSFVFTLSLIPENETVPVSYSFNGRLENVAPVITSPFTCPVDVFLTSSSPIPGPIYTLTAVNGAYHTPLKKEELRWTILNSGSTSGWQNYFSITTNPTTKAGEIYLTNALPALPAVFNLVVQVQDAVSTSGNPVTNSSIKYRSREATCQVNVSLGNITSCNGRKWTTANYNSRYFQDGSEIPQITNATDWANVTSAAWCYYNFNPANEAIYGKLYNGYAIRGEYAGWNPSLPTKVFTPGGWRIPWTGERCNLNCISGGNMKIPGTGYWQAPNTGADNSSGFNAYPGGYVKEDGTFEGFGQIAAFWTANDWGPGIVLSYDSNDKFNQIPVTGGLKNGYSVRFIDDYGVADQCWTSGDYVNCTFLDVAGNVTTVTAGGASGPTYEGYFRSSDCY